MFTWLKLSIYFWRNIYILKSFHKHPAPGRATLRIPGPLRKCSKTWILQDSPSVLFLFHPNKGLSLLTIFSPAFWVNFYLFPLYLTVNIEYNDDNIVVMKKNIMRSVLVTSLLIFINITERTKLRRFSQSFTFHWISFIENLLWGSNHWAISAVKDGMGYRAVRIGFATVFCAPPVSGHLKLHPRLLIGATLTVSALSSYWSAKASSVVTPCKVRISTRSNTGEKTYIKKLASLQSVFTSRCPEWDSLFVNTKACFHSLFT